MLQALKMSMADHTVAQIINKASTTVIQKAGMVRRVLVSSLGVSMKKELTTPGSPANEASNMGARAKAKVPATSTNLNFDRPNRRAARVNTTTSTSQFTA